MTEPATGTHAESHGPELGEGVLAQVPVFVPFAVALAAAPFLLFAIPSAFFLLAGELAAGEGPTIAVVGAVLVGVAFALGAARWISLFTLAYVRYRRLPRREDWPAYWPRVSVLVPAYNEAETMGPVLESLLALDYPRYEIVVVDDGSTDDTLRRARRFEGDHAACRVRVHTKSNGGKASALNLAFRRSSGELVLGVDADSQLRPEALRWMVSRMADPGVVAVAGYICVRNRNRMITRLQALEYMIGQGTLRLPQDRSGTVLIVPGPLGLFRRSMLEEVQIRMEQDPATAGDGPWETGTFAEDLELSLRLLGMDGRIAYEPRAVSETKAPDSATRLISQRYRWYRGLLQALASYVRRGRTEHGQLVRRVVWWLSVTYGFSLVLQPLLLATALSFVFLTLVGGSMQVFAAALAAFAVFALASWVAFGAMHGEKVSVLIVLPLYDLYQQFLVKTAWGIAALDEVRGAGMRW